mmetsp:Transcript_41837/g.58855  ORF Transcript_41837/g.58855 Transcript_41837/m.58855 type:complete len:151 (-) Transcript_41837:154-606(-)
MIVNAKPGATITLTKQRKERDAQAAKDTLQKAERGVTISLFGLEIEFPGASSPTTPSPPKPIAKKTTRSKSTPKVPKKTPSPAQKKIAAPRGVPSVKKWRRNFDGSITGLVSGAKGFKENEKITTSKIISGKIASGEVVQTGSGSKYFLV